MKKIKFSWPKLDCYKISAFFAKNLKCTKLALLKLHSLPASLTNSLYSSSVQFITLFNTGFKQWKVCKTSWHANSPIFPAQLPIGVDSFSFDKQVKVGMEERME